jgi:mannose-6-phosphate isomerase-like protein (cupin superfamily)
MGSTDAQNDVTALGACLLAISIAAPVLGQQSHHSQGVLTSEQKQKLAQKLAWGGKMFLDLDSEKTNGAVAVVRAYAPPKSGPPPHVHSREDEIFIIVKGHYRVRHGDEEVDAPPGAILFMPRNVPYVFRNISDEPGEIASLFFRAGSRSCSARSRTPSSSCRGDLAKLQEIHAKYGFKNLPPPDSMALSKPQ